MPVVLSISDPPQVVGRAPNKLLRLEVTLSDDVGPLETTKGVIYDGTTVRWPSLKIRGRNGQLVTMHPTTPAERLVRGIIETVEREWSELCQEAFGSKSIEKE